MGSGSRRSGTGRATNRDTQRTPNEASPRTSPIAALLAVACWVVAWLFFSTPFGLGTGSVELVTSIVIFGIGILAVYGGCRVKRLCGPVRAMQADGTSSRFLRALCLVFAAAMATDVLMLFTRGGSDTALAIMCAALAVASGVLGHRLRDTSKKTESLRIRLSRRARRTKAASSISETLPNVIENIFGGWIPRSFDMDADRAMAPTVQGTLERLDNQQFVFDLHGNELADYVCADVALMARAYAFRDIDETGLAAGRFVYRLTLHVNDVPDEPSVTARMLEDLVFCQALFSYERLEFKVSHTRGATSDCFVTMRVALVG